MLSGKFKFWTLLLLSHHYFVVPVTHTESHYCNVCLKRNNKVEMITGSSIWTFPLIDFTANIFKQIFWMYFNCRKSTGVENNINTTLLCSVQVSQQAVAVWRGTGTPKLKQVNGIFPLLPVLVSYCQTVKNVYCGIFLRQHRIHRFFIKSTGIIIMHFICTAFFLAVNIKVLQC